MTADRPVLVLARPDWLDRPGLRMMLEALGEARIVGGAVRDTLLGRAVTDLDLATPLPPQAVIERLRDAGIASVPTGLAHGTVTALLAAGPVEITTLRRDVETDGRHAVVAFTADWLEDAGRRDLTMNALYLDRDAALFDPLGSGLADCRAGRVRFIGEPEARIGEDVLRLLRFYRFQALYGRTAPDPQARRAASRLAGSLAGLPGERIRPELLKLLAARDPLATVVAMIEDGVLQHIVPPPHATGALARLVAIEPEADGLRRLAALLPPGSGTAVAARLRLTNQDRARLDRLLAPGPMIDPGGGPRAWRRTLYSLGAAGFRDRVLIEAARHGGEVGAALAFADRWTAPSLPVDGNDALAAGVAPGPAVGTALEAVESWWVSTDFTGDRSACLARLAAFAQTGLSAPSGVEP